jgi:hypothetical protein
LRDLREKTEVLQVEIVDMREGPALKTAETQRDAGEKEMSETDPIIRATGGLWNFLIAYGFLATMHRELPDD